MDVKARTCPFFIVDAFTAHRFGGDAAAVCLIGQALDVDAYRRIAGEFNLPTAFPIPHTTTSGHSVEEAARQGNGTHIVRRATPQTFSEALLHPLVQAHT